jgi:hypothetical protein
MTSLADRAAQIVNDIDALADLDVPVTRAREYQRHIRALIEDLVAAKEREQANADRLARCVKRRVRRTTLENEALRLYSEAVAQR